MAKLIVKPRAWESKNGSSHWLRFNHWRQAYISSRGIAKDELPRIIRFCLVGGSGIGVEIGVLWLLTDILGLFYVASAAIAFMISVTSNFTWNSLWTFRDRGQNLRFITIIKRWSKYVLSASVALAIYLGILTFITEVFNIYYLLSALCGIALAAPINFLLSYFWVWKRLPSGGEKIES